MEQLTPEQEDYILEAELERYREAKEIKAERIREGAEE